MVGTQECKSDLLCWNVNNSVSSPILYCMVRKQVALLLTFLSNFVMVTTGESRRWNPEYECMVCYDKLRMLMESAGTCKHGED